MPNRNLYILALLLAVGLMIPHASESRVFPGDEWITKSAPDLNIDQGKVDRLFDLSFEDDATQGVVLIKDGYLICLLYTSPSPRDGLLSRMPSSA